MILDFIKEDNYISNFNPFLSNEEYYNFNPNFKDEYFSSEESFEEDSDS